MGGRIEVGGVRKGEGGLRRGSRKGGGGVNKGGREMETQGPQEEWGEGEGTPE